jgi:alanyl-tRNA synthetase
VAVRYYESHRDTLAGILETVGAPPDQAAEAIKRLQTDLKRLQRENEQLKMRAALGGGASTSATDDTVDVDGVKVVARKVTGLEKAALRGLSDSLRDRLPSGVVVLASENDGKVALIVSVTKDLAGRVHAGNIVKQIAPIVGGGGGGRPDFAEAGGKDPARIDELLSKSRDVVRDMLRGAGQTR